MLLFVGQVKEAKGVLDIVDALGRLKAEGPGGGALPTAVVRVLPQQADIERWMQAADLLVSRSHEDTEGMSRVLYEAMACGVVPIATDIRGNRDAITPETGILVPERDQVAIAGAIKALQMVRRGAPPCAWRASNERACNSTSASTRAAWRRSFEMCCTTPLRGDARDHLPFGSSPLSR